MSVCKLSSVAACWHFVAFWGLECVISHVFRRQEKNCYATKLTKIITQCSLRVFTVYTQLCFLANKNIYIINDESHIFDRFTLITKKYIYICNEYNEKPCLCGKIFLYPVMLLFRLMNCEIYQQVFSVLFHSVVALSQLCFNILLASNWKWAWTVTFNWGGGL